MLNVKLETTSREKALLDEVFGEIISIIDMYDCGPEEGRQCEEAQIYKGSFQKEWAEGAKKFSQFRDYLTLMGEKLLGIQEAEPERRGGRDRYVPHTRWRPRSGYRGDDQSGMEDMAGEL